MTEAEIKAKLNDPIQLKARAEALGYKPTEALILSDVYYNGGRDFHASDEALRLREVVSGGVTTCCLTYKGPKYDKRSSMRTEHETEIASADAMRAILEALGYKPAFTVKKRREEYSNGATTLCIDEVEGLGSYMELERVLPDGTDRDAAVTALLAELDALQIDRSSLTRRSYLEMIYFPEG